MRIAEKNRITKETNVFVKCDLDWTWTYKIDTWIWFFDHMLEQFSRQSYIDIEIKATWDIHIDDHHLIEDVSIVLWEVILEALGKKNGINRFASDITPMDESLVETAVDLSNRPYLAFNVEFKREQIWQLSTEMIEHFFYTLSTSLRAAIHINERYSRNTHHLIEWIFKSMWRTIRNAIYIDPRNKGLLPSTKWKI